MSLCSAYSPLCSTSPFCVLRRSVQGDGTLQLRAPSKQRLAGQTSGFRCGPKEAAIALGVMQIVVEVLALFLTIIACKLPCIYP